ncbi:MAG: carboxypeptidase-like regulatory domain-containing protein [Bacteroidota bacterium]
MIQHLTYPKLLLIILLMLPTFSFAQAVYEGQVLNKNTELAVPNVSVILLKQKTGTQTNTQGYFNLVTETPIPNDTLVFSSVGYQTYRLPVSGYQKQMFVLLEASNTQLNEVTITNQKIKVSVLDKFTWDNIKEVNSSFYKHFTRPFFALSSFAKLFTAPQANVLLTNVQLGRREFEGDATTNKFTRFLLHVQLVDSLTGAPGEVLFNKEVSLTDNSLKVTIDLSPDKIVIPHEKFFVVIEWLTIPYNEIITYRSIGFVEEINGNGHSVIKDEFRYYTYYQPFLISYEQTEYEQTKMSPTWEKINNKWGIRLRDMKNNIALSATIHY